MKRGLEILVFGGIAIVLHMIAFQFHENDGQQASGAQGEALFFIEAAPPAVAQMVAQWERPVDVLDNMEMPALAPPNAARSAQMGSLNIETVAPRAEMRLSALVPPPVDRIEVDTVPATPVPPSPVAKPTPKPESAPKAPPKPRRDANKASKTQQSSQAQPQQRAAGRGGATQAGDKSDAKLSTSSPGQQASLTEIWKAKIFRKISRTKRYPKGTRASGTNSVKFKVRHDGALVGLSLARSSGDAVLDDAALASVKRANRFPKAPKGLEGSVFTFAVPMNWSRR